MTNYQVSRGHWPRKLEVGKYYRRPCGALFLVTGDQGGSEYSATVIEPSESYPLNYRVKFISSLMTEYTQEEYNPKSDNFNNLYEKLSS